MPELTAGYVAILDDRGQLLSTGAVSVEDGELDERQALEEYYRARVRGVAERLIPGLREEVSNLAGQTSLAEAIDLMSAATAVVSNDSGLMHVAAALNRPLVAVYGSTSPQCTPPLAEQVEIVRLGRECSPCFERTCRFGHYDCLRQLKPRAVIEALDRLVPQPVEVK